MEIKIDKFARALFVGGVSRLAASINIAYSTLKCSRAEAATDAKPEEEKNDQTDSAF